MFRPLWGHLQALWENRSKSYLYFNALWDPKCLQIVLQECEIYKFVCIGTRVTFLALKINIIWDGDILKPILYKRLYKNLFLIFSF